MTIEELRHLKESEDKVEFKEDKTGQFAYDGGSKPLAKDRRKCILGYVVAFANEGGGKIVFGMKDPHPHEVVGTRQSLGAVGKLEEAIYRDLRIRVTIYELLEGSKRVMVIDVPGRPVGKVFKFEDVPLMRVGEELLPMSDEQYLRIINEQEPDFSAKICKDLKMDDLDKQAIQKMKDAYADKQKNPRFLSLSDEQVLNDLELSRENKLTYAALILLGKSAEIKRHLPQSAVNLEFRENPNLIRYDKRFQFQQPYYLLADELWKSIDARNKNIPIQQGPYIFDIPLFNKEVIREAVNNAVAHRDYNKASEVVIKQTPTTLTILNPGGFPSGVNVNNLLTVSSTPRNRLLSEVLSKTGIVERSGQGVDKIFYQCLSEAKGMPDYSESDFFQVVLHLSAIVKDQAFALFIKYIQKDRDDVNKLGVAEVITLDKIRQGEPKENLNDKIVQRLLNDGLIEKRGQTRGIRYVLAKTYFTFTDQRAKYSRDVDPDAVQAMILICGHVEEFDTAKMKDFVELFEGKLTRKQVRNLIEKFVTDGTLDQHGEGQGTYYTIGRAHVERKALYNKALQLGMDQMKKEGQL